MFYKNFMLVNNATYNFSVIPIIGTPTLLVKLSNTPVYPISADVLSWDYISNTGIQQTQSVISTYTDRSGRYSFCQYAGYNLNGGN